MVDHPDTQQNDGGFAWFETSVNGGVAILSLIRQAATVAPVPYLKQAAGLTVEIIGIIQSVKDNKSDFRRLGRDAASLLIAVIESYEQSESKDDWPGARLEGAMESLMKALVSIQAFAQKQLKRGLPGRAFNYVADGRTIRVYREMLNEATNRFGLSSQLEASDLLRTINSRMKSQDPHYLDAWKRSVDSMSSLQKSDHHQQHLDQSKQRVGSPSPRPAASQPESEGDTARHDATPSKPKSSPQTPQKSKRQSFVESRQSVDRNSPRPRPRTESQRDSSDVEAARQRRARDTSSRTKKKSRKSRRRRSESDSEDSSEGHYSPGWNDSGYASPSQQQQWPGPPHSPWVPNPAFVGMPHYVTNVNSGNVTNSIQTDVGNNNSTVVKTVKIYK